MIRTQKLQQVSGGGTQASAVGTLPAGVATSEGPGSGVYRKKQNWKLGPIAFRVNKSWVGADEQRADKESFLASVMLFL